MYPAIPLRTVFWEVLEPKSGRVLVSGECQKPGSRVAAELCVWQTLLEAFEGVSPRPRLRVWSLDEGYSVRLF